MGFELPGVFPKGSGGYSFPNVPSAASFTITNSAANVSLTDLTGRQGGVRFVCPDSGGAIQWRIAEVAGTVSSLIAYRTLTNSQIGANFGLSGVCLRNSTSGRLGLLYMVPSTGTAPTYTTLLFSEYSAPNAFNVNPTRINPITLALGTTTCQADVIDMPVWLGVKVGGANIECWVGYDDAPDNLFKLFTASGSGTYVSGGGGSIDRMGFCVSGYGAGADTAMAMDVHSFYSDAGL